MPSPLEYEFLASALCPTAAPRALGVVLIDEFKRVWVPNELGGHTLSSISVTVPFRLVRKIRASIAAAEMNNSVQLAPWNAAPAWMASTAYGYCQVVSSFGKDYICTTFAGGTSGITPPTGAGPAVVSDGTLSWLYLGTSRVAAPAYDAPVVTQSATITGLTRRLDCSTAGVIHPSMRFGGGVPFVQTDGRVAIASSYYSALGNLNGQGGIYGNAAYHSQMGYWEVMTDAPKIGFQVNNGLDMGIPVSVEVNNRLVQPGAIVPGVDIYGGSIILDWTGSAALGRIVRKIRIRAYRLSSYLKCNIDPLSSVWQPKNPNRFKVAIEGDSLTAGAAANATNAGHVGAGMSWAEQFCNLIGCDDYFISAIGGTGFINQSAYSTYIQRLPFLASQSPDVLVIAGNYNDSASTSTLRQGAILAYLQAARAALPNCIIVVFGAWGSQSSAVTSATWPAPPAANANAYITQDADMRAAVVAFADTNTVFFSTINDPEGSWIYGTGKTNTPANNGNADLHVSTIGVHPTQQGHDYMARKYSAAFKSIINSWA